MQLYAHYKVEWIRNDQAAVTHEEWEGEDVEIGDVRVSMDLAKKSYGNGVGVFISIGVRLPPGTDPADGQAVADAVYAATTHIENNIGFVMERAQAAFLHVGGNS
ncbi:hypothetical protein EBT31_00100 [bacterium]|nr:hypothetical protein [bacterium]